MKWGRKVVFPANPNLAAILRDMDLDFKISHYFNLLDPKFLDLQVLRFSKSGLGK